MRKLSRQIIAALLAVAVALQAAPSQQADGEEPPEMRYRRMNGPRLGVVYVLQHEDLDRDGSFNQKLEENKIGSVISQFGWHFEGIVRPERGGPAFVTEFIPCIGGVEHGTLIPSMTLVWGIRLPAGFEFGMGPNVVFTFTKEMPVSSAVVIGIGQSLKFGGVSIPLNLAVLTNKGGNRVSFMFGYAVPSRKKRARTGRSSPDRAGRPASPWND
jgi:hypothetical protein